MRRSCLCGSVVALASLGITNAASAAFTFVNSDQVNLLRRYNLPAFSFAVSANEPRTINGAGIHNGNFSSDPVVLTYDLGKSMPIGSFRLEQSGNRWSQDWTIEVSNTGVGSMTTVVNVTGDPGDNHFAPITAQSARYIRYTGNNQSAGGLDVMNEFYAYSPAGESIDIRSGYDLLQDSAVVTGTTSSGINGGSTPEVFDDSQQSHIKAQTSNAVFTISLNDSYKLGAAHLGWFNGQTWSNGFTIWTSNDVSLPNQLNNSLWSQAYTFGSIGGPGAGDERFALFTSERFARHLRVTWNQDNGALTDFEVFAVPEPMSLAAVVLAGGAAMLRRRR